MIYTIPISEKIMRVICTEGEREPGDRASLLVQPQPPFEGICAIEVSRKGDALSFAHAGKPMFAQTGFSMEPKEIYRYTFSGGKPKIVTRRTVDGERSFVENADTIKVGDAYEGALTLRITPEEAIYGLGQQEDGIYNYRNVKEYLYHNNMKIPMPVFLSSNQYAVFFDCTSMFTYEEKENVITMTFDAVDQIDYYVIAGECFDELVAGIRQLTGAPAMLPKWAFGYIQSKERYKTQQEILDTAARFQAENIPLDCIVLDWLSWEEGKWGNKIFDKSRFPDAKAMVEQLHRDGVAFMISIWPNCKEGSENNNEFAKAGKLLCNYSTYDAFDEEARDMYWKQCQEELFPAGTDAWWCDSTEPFTPDWNGLEKLPGEVRYKMAKESTNQYLDARNSSAYCLMHAKGIYEHQRAADPARRVTNLTRAGYPGIQKYGTILWSGDIAATWEVLKAQVAEGLSMCLSGIPFWTLDIGAFFAGNTESWKRWANQTEGQAPWFWHGLFEEGTADKGYCELYTRWLQFGAFLPIMRSHGTDTPREPWNFGEKGTVYYDTILKYIRLRKRLMPYVYSNAMEAALEAGTMMRSLMFDFAGDGTVKTISDEYMFGKAFLVCPVTEAMEYGPDSRPLHRPMKRRVYLPKHVGWYEYETKAFLDGGQAVEADAPITSMPLYVKAGSLIPMSEKGGLLPEIMEIYGGADGSFTLIVDNGQDYAYEEGCLKKITFTWKDQEEQLYIDGGRGSYPVDAFDMQVILYTPDGGKQETKIRWEGKPVTCNL